MHKQGQGKASRTGAMILGLLIAFYGSFSLFMYTIDTSKLESGNLTSIVTSFAFIGSVIVFVLGVGLSFHIALQNPKTGDYLIDMDIELRKVVWPAAIPLFDPKTEAWGSTYVVIGCTIFLTFFIAAVDWLFNISITQGLLTLIFS